MADLIDKQSVVDIAMCYCPDDDGSCSKADADIRELLDEIENLQAVNRWIPCSERLPEQSGIYLVFFTFKDGTHATDIAYINTGCHLGSITHWMPLPEPPKGVEVNDGSN